VAQLAPGLRALSILKPIPLERELTVRVSAGRVTVLDGDVEIGNSEVRGAPLAVTIPGRISLDEAREAGSFRSASAAATSARRATVFEYSRARSAHA
jgi:hypothetical protein